MRVQLAAVLPLYKGDKFLGKFVTTNQKSLGEWNSSANGDSQCDPYGFEWYQLDEERYVEVAWSFIPEFGLNEKATLLDRDGVLKSLQQAGAYWVVEDFLNTLPDAIDSNSTTQVEESDADVRVRLEAATIEDCNSRLCEFDLNESVIWTNRNGSEIVCRFTPCEHTLIAEVRGYGCDTLGIPPKGQRLYKLNESWFVNVEWEHSLGQSLRTTIYRIDRNEMLRCAMSMGKQPEALAHLGDVPTASDLLATVRSAPEVLKQCAGATLEVADEIRYLMDRHGLTETEAKAELRDESERNVCKLRFQGLDPKRIDAELGFTKPKTGKKAASSIISERIDKRISERKQRIAEKVQR